MERRLGAASVSVAEECWSLTAGCAGALQLLLDRLERLGPGDHGRAPERLRHSRGHLWKAFAEDLVGRENPAARQVLAVAAVAPRVDVGLLAGSSVAAATGDLESLRERGLLVEAGAAGHYRLSPVLIGAVADDNAGNASRRPDSDRAAGTLRERVAAWLEGHGRFDEALECHADGAQGPARSFLVRCGPTLIRTGAAARLIEVLRRAGTGGALDLAALLAEALQAVGEWDAAIDLFARMERSAGSGGLPAATAWRYGLLLYLRGQSEAAAATLEAAHDPARLAADDAMVSAWLSTTLWSQGQVGRADELAGAAVRQAGASGDSCAMAAAQVSMSLVAASRGERDRNEQAYRLALVAARDSGDRVQLARRRPVECLEDFLTGGASAHCGAGRSGRSICYICRNMSIIWRAGRTAMRGGR